MSDMTVDFDCRCNTWKPRTVSPDAVAAYCSECLGWTKRPTRAGTLSEEQRIKLLAGRGIEPAMPVEDPMPNQSTSRQARKQRIARAQNRRCRNGHQKEAPGPCRVCQRERTARQRVKAAVHAKTLTNPQVDESQIEVLG